MRALAAVGSGNSRYAAREDNEIADLAALTHEVHAGSLTIRDHGDAYFGAAAGDNFENRCGYDLARSWSAGLDDLLLDVRADAELFDEPDLVGARRAASAPREGRKKRDRAGIEQRAFECLDRRDIWPCGAFLHEDAIADLLDRNPDVRIELALAP